MVSLFYPANLIFKDLYINFLYINPWNYAWKAHAINTTPLMHMPGVDKSYKKQTNLRIIISLYHLYKSSQLFQHFNYKVTLPVLKYCSLCNKSFHFMHVMSLTTVQESFYNPSALQRQQVCKKLNNITRKLNKNIVPVLNLWQCVYMKYMWCFPHTLPSIPHKLLCGLQVWAKQPGSGKKVASSGAIVPKKWYFMKATCKGQKLQNNFTKQLVGKGVRRKCEWGKKMCVTCFQSNTLTT